MFEEFTCEDLFDAYRNKNEMHYIPVLIYLFLKLVMINHPDTLSGYVISIKILYCCTICNGFLYY